MILTNALLRLSVQILLPLKCENKYNIRMKRENVSIKTIASLSGVSVATVSRI